MRLYSRVSSKKNCDNGASSFERVSMPHGSPRIRFADGSMNLVGSRLKQRRQQAHLTQDQLCGALAHITEGAWIPTRHDIYRIESGTRTVSDAEVIALAAGLECSLLWLLCGEESEAAIKHFAARIFHEARPAVEVLTKPSEP